MERDGTGAASVIVQMTEWTLGKQLDRGGGAGNVSWAGGVKERERCGGKQRWIEGRKKYEIRKKDIRTD